MDSPPDRSLYTLVKPSFSETQVLELCSRLYAFQPTLTVQLAGYDDQNIWIKKVNPINKRLHEIWPDGYVLKITNSKESENVPLIEAQIKILLHLADHSINAPVPVKNTNENYYSLESVEGSGGVCYSHAVRLFTFRSGELLKQVEVNETLSRQLGIFLFKLDNCLKPLSHPALMNRDLLFMLDKVPKLKEFLHVIKDKRKEELVAQCITQFEDEVMTHMDELEKGIIHGDFNEQNIVIKGNDISAILDFGDCHFAPYIFELAVGLTYIILLTRDFKLVKHFISGYTEKRKLTCLEEKTLMVCVRARMCQSLVLGLHAYSLNPTNEYILSTQKDGWEVLELLQGKNDLMALSTL